MPYRPPDELPSLAQYSYWATFDHSSARDDMHSWSSSQSNTANSSPISPVFAEFSRHNRMPSSNSSLSSSPTLCDSHEATLSTRKTLLEGLPEVDEDHVERDARQDQVRSIEPLQPTYHGNRWSYSPQKTRPASYFRTSTDHEQHDVLYGDDHEGHWAKRRRSGDFAWNSFAAGIASKFPSISRRSSRQKKRATTSFVDSRYESSPSPPSTSSPTFLSRSSSLVRSLGRQSLERDVEQEDPQQVHANIETIMEDDFLEPSMPPYDDRYDETDLPLPPQNEPRSTTPLLPPLMDPAMTSPSVQSPLQLPTVATDIGIPSVSHTPTGTPQLSGVTSPALSARPSISSIHRWRYSTVAPTTELAPLIMADQDDEWAEKLGHANFKIFPEPYVPETHDEESCQMLMKDWETARSEYAKHLSRTEMHFGKSSTTFKLTEEKWATIDARWKVNNEIVSRRAAGSGVVRQPSPKEPAPVAKIPTIDDPRLIQSEDIPGPMAMDEPVKQLSSQLKRRLSKREQIRKILGNFQFAGGAAHGRAASVDGAR